MIRGISSALNAFAKERNLPLEVMERTNRLLHEFSRTDWNLLAPMDTEALKHAEEHLEDGSLAELQQFDNHAETQTCFESRVQELVSICRELNVTPLAYWCRSEAEVVPRRLEAKC
jgi:hypothetical protein